MFMLIVSAGTRLLGALGALLSFPDGALGTTIATGTEVNQASRAF